MTAALAPSTPLEAATSAWRLANGRERSHAKRCSRLAHRQRCLICLHLEAITNCAADEVERARAMRAAAV